MKVLTTAVVLDKYNADRVTMNSPGTILTKTTVKDGMNNTVNNLVKSDGKN